MTTRSSRRRHAQLTEPADGVRVTQRRVAKAEARQLSRNAIASGELEPRFVMARINALDTEWGADDIEALSGCSPDAILLPKVNESADVHRVLKLLNRHENLQNTQIWAMMETPRGVMNAVEIAGCRAVVVGTDRRAIVER